ncbi:uncharacterized protein KY384_002263 [Bacidia gigantensis]|uniref:uncharacterized protein n=1 Tax=Bacidia gigantensis TaxID=2732470 RepID=UPI001D039585|nr:uncharacterized protein KY384_002263 [Bacidia gigantensis]KAG8533480.1 hypothetical protein KY384_002263 [Bacidia gigantensis]
MAAAKDITGQMMKIYANRPNRKNWFDEIMHGKPQPEKESPYFGLSSAIQIALQPLPNIFLGIIDALIFGVAGGLFTIFIRHFTPVSRLFTAFEQNHPIDYGCKTETGNNKTLSTPAGATTKHDIDPETYCEEMTLEEEIKHCKIRMKGYDARTDEEQKWLNDYYAKSVRISCREDIKRLRAKYGREKAR